MLLELFIFRILEFKLGRFAFESDRLFEDETFQIKIVEKYDHSGD